jgi:hypothetical protein
MPRSTNSAFTRVFDRRSGALLFRVHMLLRWIPALRRIVKRRCTASGTRRLVRRKAIIVLAPWAFPSGP